jgi:hypothetical protein
VSKVTVITDLNGKIQGIGHGHLSEVTVRRSGAKGFQSGIRPLAGQRLQEIDLAEDVSRVKTWKELFDKVRPNLKP